MRKANIYMQGMLAAELTEEVAGKNYGLKYVPEYQGPPISLTLPIKSTEYRFEEFPPVLDGLLPEGNQLEGLLRHQKIDEGDYFSQLMAVGKELVGAMTVEPAP